ncbi:hypothetical protein [Paludibacterium purpuratum]|uniref:FimV N-terminal domain-containing protein n=1 Tax=Paludibacterium purpuratum TaxID=1144873 RepID=A0A4R7BAW5_9NEIS|nr:hypothetical protein [Paludibacterium purpuratum]TDR82100.1 hypothetical protein DFP86_102214 [Paludibacterium purpuratum]
MTCPLRRHLLAAAVSGLFVWPHCALAGLGRIEVLSAPGEAFSAIIPFVDDMPTGDTTVALADRHRYPMLSPFSASADRLHFTLQRAADGKPTGVLVAGPARLPENELDFAVAVQWDAGGAVREYQLDARRAAHKSPAPVRDDDKKPQISPAAHGGVDNIALGALKVHSAPGAPLVAEAAWLGRAPIDPARLRVRVSPAGAGTPSPEMLALLSSLKYALAPGPDGGRLLQLHSQLPLDLPQLDFRLDVSLGDARAARRYRLTLRGQTVHVAEFGAISPKAAFRVVRVLPGDTLSAVVRRLRHEGVSPGEAMRRLYRENPRAFIDGDMDLLLAGALLRYPAQWAPASAPLAPPVAATPASGDAEAVRLSALRGKLAQQERLLSSAHEVSQALEQKLADLKRHHTPVPAPVQPAPAAGEARLPPTLAMAGGGAALVAAAVTALALRRRRLRVPGASSDGAATGTPTVEGLRQWLRYDPTRDDLRYRLLLLLASQNDLAGFIDQAEAARERFEPDSEMWQGVLRMGRELAPEHDWEGRPAEPEPRNAPMPEAMPERPLLELGGLDDLAAEQVAFRDTQADPTEAAPELPEQIDQQALAQLFMEMGDRQSAQNLRHHPGA